MLTLRISIFAEQIEHANKKPDCSKTAELNLCKDLLVLQ